MSINKQEAGCFYTQCMFQNLTTSEALEQLKTIQFPQKSGVHRPTFVRLAKKLVMNLDDKRQQAEESRKKEEKRIKTNERLYGVLDEETKEEIRSKIKKILLIKTSKTRREKARLYRQTLAEVYGFNFVDTEEVKKTFCI